MFTLLRAIVSFRINSIVIDHKAKAQDDGKGSIENGQLTHPYCNSTFISNQL